MQAYLKPNTILNNEAKFHFKARSSMLNLRGNMKNQFKDVNFCQGCLNVTEPETQTHVFYCSSLSLNEVSENNVQYDDLFCPDLQKQLVVSNILKKRIQKRDELIKLREERTNTHKSVGSL